MGEESFYVGKKCAVLAFFWKTRVTEHFERTAIATYRPQAGNCFHVLRVPSILRALDNTYRNTVTLQNKNK